MSTFYRLSVLPIVVSLVIAGCTPAPSPTPIVLPAPTISVTNTPIPPRAELQPTATPPAYPAVPYELISQDSLFAYLTDLTSIQPYSGWRNAGSSGEVEALDYVAGKLSEFSNLQTLGLELERQSFPVYLSTELWDSGLTLTVKNQKIKIPAEGLRASRYNRQAAVYFDTDGVFNDSNLDPIAATGVPLIVRDDEALYTLTVNEFKGRIVFLDYSLIDRYVNSEAYLNSSQLVTWVDRGAAGVVIVTQYSNQVGESHGAILGDGATFQYEVPTKRVPFLYVRIEDLSPAGITTWTDLEQIESAQLLLDSDVFSPGKSGNLIAHIPGADSSLAVILGAHIDSPNGPGAFDDGSGAAALLEIARVLDVSHVQPPVDVYLAWFGGHEIATYGSAYFAATHQELLDRTLAMFQMDCLGRPLDGKTSNITMFLTSYGRFGNESLPLPDFLDKAVTDQGVALDRMVEYALIADNSNFDIFNVPNIDLIYLNAVEWRTKGASYIHYSNHFHDPYETVERAREVADAFVGMTKVMLAAALETGRAQPNLRVAAAQNRRALIVASHTESINLTTGTFRELGMALAWEGFDVDLIPYGQAITPADLENVGIVVLPPTLDYPGPHNETWGETELAVLNGYVAAGGFLVVVNSAYNYATVIRLDERNEDARALNALLEPMGVTFTYGVSGDADIARAVAEHPLTANATYLTFFSDNVVPFKMETGLELIQAAGFPIVGLVDYGEQGGQVLVIADLGILRVDNTGAKNMDFLKNIARYARTR